MRSALPGKLINYIFVAISAHAFFYSVKSVDAQQHLYWSDNSNATIFRCEIPCSNPVPLIQRSDGQEPAKLAIDDINEVIYWTVPTMSQVWRANLDGSNPTLVANTISGLNDIAVDQLNGFLYFCDSAGVTQTDLLGNGPILFQEPSISNTIVHLSIDPLAGFLLYAESIGGDATLYRKPLSAVAMPNLIFTDQEVGGIVARTTTGQFVYNSNQSSTVRAVGYNPLVGESTPFFSVNNPSQMGPMGIDRNDNIVFWADAMAGGILQSSLTAPAPQIYVPATDPRGIALDCGRLAIDEDGDSTPDCLDACDIDPLKIAPGTCGCGVTENDGDGDGSADCNDQCPIDALKSSPGSCGCGVPDSDSDGDGTADCLEECPTESGKILAGACGCSVPDLDTDGDTIFDCLDGCPLDKFKASEGVCGCGFSDIIGAAGIVTCEAIRELNPKTTLSEPPRVVVNVRDATVILEKFTAAFTNKKKKKKKIGSSVRAVFYEPFAAKSGLTKGKVSYEIVLNKEGTGKRDARAATSKKSEYTFKNLPPGNYSVKYRAQIIVGKQVASKTNFSPPAGFSIQ